MSLNKALELAKQVQDELCEVNPDYSHDAECCCEDLIGLISVAIQDRDEKLGEIERMRARQQGVG